MRPKGLQENEWIAMEQMILQIALLTLVVIALTIARRPRGIS